MIDLEYDEIDAELATSVRRLGADRLADWDGHPAEGPDGWWGQLAELGVLGLGTEEGGGGATTIAASMEALGEADAPGPLPQTFIAGQLVDADTRAGLASGTLRACVVTTQPAAWLAQADLVILVDGHDARLAEPADEIEPVDTPNGEPWGRGRLVAGPSLGDSEKAMALGDVAVSAYLVGAAHHLLTEAAAYAADRVQFRAPIGTFQGLAHPLADCRLRLDAARALTRIAAHSLDQAGGDAAARAATARRSATKAALGTAFACHQTYGAMGFTVEGPIGRRSATIRQISLVGDRPAEIDQQILAGNGLG